MRGGFSFIFTFGGQDTGHGHTPLNGKLQIIFMDSNNEKGMIVVCAIYCKTFPHTCIQGGKQILDTTLGGQEG